MTLPSNLAALFDEKRIPHSFPDEQAKSTKKLEDLPVFLTVSNSVSPDLAKRYGLREGDALKRPLIEYRYKNSGNAFVSEDHILSFNWVKDQDVIVIRNLALRANDFLKEQGCLNFNIEFGHIKGDVMVTGVKL